MALCHSDGSRSAWGERQGARSAPGEEPEAAPAASRDAVDRSQTGAGSARPVLLPSSADGPNKQTQATRGHFQGEAPGRSPQLPAKHEVVMGWCENPGNHLPALGSPQHPPPPCQPGLSPPGPAARGSSAGAACPAPRHGEPRGRVELCVPRAIRLVAFGLRKGMEEGQ